MVIQDRWEDVPPKNLDLWVSQNGIDGIVAQVNTLKFEEQLMALSIPVVNVANILPNPRLPTVTQDDLSVGRMAAEHLGECRCAALACWGIAGAIFSQDRIRGFAAEAATHCHVMEGSGIGSESGEPLIARMVAWLKPLPRPLGVFSVMDVFAVHMLKAIHRLGWRVRQDVVVLGAGNEEFLVQYETPPISSVELPSRQIGYEAAAMLHSCMMGRERHPHAFMTFGPMGVASRQSTDIVFMDDPAVARALDFIRSRRTGAISVGEITRAAELSRIPLQRRFKERLGRTIRQEVQRSRIELAKSLLRSSEETIGWVAQRCRFPSSQRFAVVFRKQTGLSPGQFRKTAHPASGKGPVAGENHSSGSLD
jgi:LacI family transcriptional regulator